MAFIRLGQGTRKKRISYSDLYKKVMGKPPLKKPVLKTNQHTRRSGQLQKEQLDAFFRKLLKSHTRIYLKSGNWERLATKDKAFIIAESLKQYRVLDYAPSLVRGTIIPIVREQPTKFAMGLGKTTTFFFFSGLSTEAEIFFKAIGKDVGKFVKRIYYKDQFAEGVNARAFGKGISKNIDSFVKAMGKEGLVQFDKAMQRKGKIPAFFSGLGKSQLAYLAGLKKT